MDGNLRNMTAIYLLKNQKVLLLYKAAGRVVRNVWVGSAGGHFENDELNDAQTCVLRELKEELDLGPSDIDGLSMRYIALRNTNGEIRLNYYFFAELKASVDDNLSSTEGVCRWFSPSEVHSLPMPHTAKYVVEHYFKVGHLTDKLYIGVTGPKTLQFLDLPES